MPALVAAGPGPFLAEAFVAEFTVGRFGGPLIEIDRGPLRAIRAEVPRVISHATSLTPASHHVPPELPPFEGDSHCESCETGAVNTYWTAQLGSSGLRSTRGAADYQRDWLLLDNGQTLADAVNGGGLPLLMSGTER